MATSWEKRAAGAARRALMVQMERMVSSTFTLPDLGARGRTMACNTTVIDVVVLTECLNKAKCLSEAVETPLSLLHCHTLCLIGLHQVWNWNYLDSSRMSNCNKDCVNHEEWRMLATANAKAWTLVSQSVSQWHGLKPETPPRLKRSFENLSHSQTSELAIIYPDDTFSV